MMRPKIGGSLIGEEAQILEDIRRAASMAETRRINRYVKSKEAMKNASQDYLIGAIKIKPTLVKSYLTCYSISLDYLIVVALTFQLLPHVN